MTTSRPSGEAEYSIAAVSKLTGVSCHALRVWERRYGFPIPIRSASGHRRFSRDQVLLLRTVSELARTGKAIGDVIAEVRAGHLTIQDVAGSGESPAESRAGELLDRLLAGDIAGASACFSHLAHEFPPRELVLRVIGPALVDVGERWFRRECDVFQEHCVSVYLQGKLDVLIEEARRANPDPPRTILIGSVEGDRHLGGVLLLNWYLEHSGWRAVNLGVDLPVGEYRKAVRLWKPHALGLSFALSRNINKRFQELSEIAEIPVFVGGRSILNYQGLARRNGLIPLPGSVTLAVEQLQVEFERWAPQEGGVSAHA